MAKTGARKVGRPPGSGAGRKAVSGNGRRKGAKKAAAGRGVRAASTRAMGRKKAAPSNGRKSAARTMRTAASPGARRAAARSLAAESPRTRRSRKSAVSEGMHEGTESMEAPHDEQDHGGGSDDMT